MRKFRKKNVSRKKNNNSQELLLLEGTCPEIQGERRETMYHGMAMLQGGIIQEFSERHSSYEFQKIRRKEDKVETCWRRRRGGVKAREGASGLERATLELLGSCLALLDIGDPPESMHAAQHCTGSGLAILVTAVVSARKLALLRLSSEGPRHEGHTAGEGQVPILTKNTHVRVVEPAGALELGALDLDAVAVQQAAYHADRARVRLWVQQGAPGKDIRVCLHEIENLRALTGDKGHE